MLKTIDSQRIKEDLIEMGKEANNKRKYVEHLSLMFLTQQICYRHQGGCKDKKYLCLQGASNVVTQEQILQ